MHSSTTDAGTPDVPAAPEPSPPVPPSAAAGSWPYAAISLPVEPIFPARTIQPAESPQHTGSFRAATPLRQLALLIGYLTAGVVLTWPRASYLAGSLPATRDAGGYVWDFWWVARQVTHLGNPWYTSYLAAPAGTQLGFHTLMPLPGLLMTPVTLVSGPSVSYNLLSAACPGLLCFAMYRAARLWLPTIDAVAVGAFYGLSASLAWRSFYELNLALGALFLPLALAAAVRLCRDPSKRRAAMLGIVLAACLLTDQESAVLAALLAGLALLPWLLRQPSAAKFRLAGHTALVAIAVASPQIIAMVQQAAGSGAATAGRILVQDYNASGAGLVQMFAPSPRLASDGLGDLSSLYYHGRPSMVVTGYGLTLTLLALGGLLAAWRRPAARLLALLWLGCSALALGSQPWIYDHSYIPLAGRVQGMATSLAMPYTWLVRLPGMANFREADRFTELGLVAAALLAGAAVGWLRTHHRKVLLAALAMALLEAGWPGNPAQHNPIGTIPTAMPALDRPIAADHSRSVVVDVPFGLRGGLPVLGGAFPPQSMVLATADGHPLANAFISRIPRLTLAAIQHSAFYTALMNAQGGPATSTRQLVTAAAISARTMHIGWVVVWVDNRAVDRLLLDTGFTFAYQADGASVYRPVTGPLPPSTASTQPGDTGPGRPAAAR